MEPSTLNGNWDNILFAVPLVGLLVFGYFRVDEIFVSRKHTRGAHRHPSRPVADPSDPSHLTDPDGRPWN
ncbi:MAG TPA: hypothetical protein VG225_05845 [Terracidiphilus sp.]|nr:hypothetical protein [Terracidiphilus sp.]